MRENPAAALAAALPEEDRARLLAAMPAAADLLESTGDWEGPVELLVADDFEHGTSEVSYHLRSGEQTLDVFFPVSPKLKCGDIVQVRGMRIGTSVATESSTLIEHAAASCSTTADQKTVVILVSFPSTPLPAGMTPAFVQNTFFGPTGSVDGYWRETSSGSASASGVVAGPFTLPTDFACDQTSAMRTAAIAAADATVNFSNFTRIFIIHPIPATGCTWGGLGNIGCGSLTSPGDGPFTASTSWIPVSTSSVTYGFTGIASHEGGHNLGLGHARSLDYGAVPLGVPGVDGAHTEYGDYFSTMGANQGHYAAFHKNFLGWFSGSNLQSVEAPGTFTLAPTETSTSALKAIRVRRGAGSNYWLWLEYRQPIGYDSTLNSQAFNGAIVHYADSAAAVPGSPTEILDFNPTATPNSFSDAPLASGRSWSDPYSTLTLVAGAASAGGLSVSVSYDTACATFSPPSRTHGPATETGSISVTAPGTCSWSAISSAEWITVTGGQSGTGNGTISYSVSPNATSSARTAVIFISRQNFTVTQQARPVPVSVTPANGTGASQTFAFVYSDSFDFAQLPWVEMNINSSTGVASSCYAHYEQSTNQITLRKDDDSGWIGPIAAGGNGVLQNSQCAISGPGSSVAGAGVNLTVNLALSFRSGFTGAKNVYMRTVYSGSPTSWQQKGAWTVNAALSMISATPGTGSGSTQTFSFLVANSDANTQVYVNFNNSTAEVNSCSVSIYGQYAYLRNDAGTQSSFVQLGAGGTAQNSQCVLTGAGSSATTASSDLTITLAVSFKAAFAGKKNVYIRGWSASYYTDWQIRGIWTVVPGPLAVSVAPDSGTGANQIFRFVVSDPPGYANLQWVEMNINATAGTASACYVRYDPGTNSISLRSNDDSSWLGPVAPGSGGIVQNSQCAISGPGSAAAGSGTNLTIDLAVSFRSAFAGAKKIYLQTRNPGVATGWQQRGAWTVNGALGMISVTPGTGSGAAQAFAFLVANIDANTQVYVNLNATTAEVNACAIYISGQYAYLQNDAGTQSTWVQLGGSGTAQNSQCILSGAGSSAASSGTDLTITLALNFKPAFAGPKNIYIRGWSTGFYTDWQLRGRWTVTSPACIFVLNPATASAAANGESASTPVNAPSGCGWGAVSNAPWLSVSSGQSGTGAGSAGYVAAPNLTGVARSGTLTIAGQTFTVNQAGVQAPVAAWTGPPFGNGFNQSFTFAFSHSAGWQSLTVLNILINNALDGRQACYLAYVVQGDTLLLVNDGGAAGGPFAGNMQLGTANSISNGQCTIFGVGSSAAGNGNTLMLTLNMSFSSGFTGNKVVYLAGRDGGSGNSGWQALGAWGVPGAAPTGPAVGVLSPGRSTGSSQTFTFTFTNATGWQNIAVTNILINSALDGRRACYLAFVPSGANTGTLLLVDDAGAAGGPFAGSMQVGSGGISNGQCAISGTGSSVAGSGNSLVLTLPITFSQSFAGNRVVYAATRTGSLNSGWQAIGSVTVP